MRNVLIIFLILTASTLAYAHVGSADAFYEGNAGPYHLFVTVRLPNVIPGIAEIEMRSDSPDVESIQVVPLRLTGPGSDLPPTPDIAKQSTEDPQFFVSKLWFMEFGSMQVRMAVNGSKGKGVLSIPIASFTRQSLPMALWLRVLLGISVCILTVGVVLIPGAIARESTLPPGKALPTVNKRRGWFAMALGLLVAFALLYQNKTEWNLEASTYKSYVDLLKPPKAEAKLVGGDRLVIRPADKLLLPIVGQDGMSREVKMDELIPDHGHLMHLFVISMPRMDKMWHLHPDRADSDSFAQKLPSMPAGQYEVFADVVDKNGFPWTMVGNVNLPQINGAALVGDDSEWQGAQLKAPLIDSRIAQLPDGARMVWERSDVPIKANAPMSFKFHVETKDGSPAHELEPYMGMAAHAEIVCSDLSVFAHIHPNGSVPMAALDMAQAGLMAHSSSGASGMPMNMDMGSSGPISPEFKFPYGFPHAGDYRIFIQIKRSGQVQSAAFDAHVQ